MGGLGSGKWRRRRKKTYLEDCRTLDLACMRRLGAIPSCGKSAGTWQWLDEQTGKIVANIGYETDTSNPNNRVLRVHYSVEGKKSVDYRIGISVTTPNYGGERFWFICPVTGQRVTRLYLYDGVFVSRHVCRLAYESQSENHLRRLNRKKWKIAEKADNRRGFPVRPKGMHKKTYKRIFRAFFDLEEEVENRIFRRYRTLF